MTPDQQKSADRAHSLEDQTLSSGLHVSPYVERIDYLQKEAAARQRAAWIATPPATPAPTKGLVAQVRSRFNQLNLPILTDVLDRQGGFVRPDDSRPDKRIYLLGIEIDPLSRIGSALLLTRSLEIPGNLFRAKVRMYALQLFDCCFEFETRPLRRGTMDVAELSAHLQSTTDFTRINSKRPATLERDEPSSHLFFVRPDGSRCVLVTRPGASCFTALAAHGAGRFIPLRYEFTAHDSSGNFRTFVSIESDQKKAKTSYFRASVPTPESDFEVQECIEAPLVENELMLVLHALSRTESLLCKGLDKYADRDGKS